MTNAKNTKRAMLASLLSMMVCMAMLVGSTFAWFTDSVTSGKNTIVAGNLDVELYAKNGNAGTYATVAGNEELFLKDALWEPGHVEVVNLKVANLGTLALKYQFSINVADQQNGTNVNGETFKLSDYIMFAVVDGEQTYADRDKAIAAAEATAVKLSEYATNGNGVLYPAAKETEENPAEKYVTLIAYMPTTVGKEANYKTGTPAPTIDLGINLVATQIPLEKDSFNENYDEKAAYPIVYPAGVTADSFAENQAAVTSDGTFIENTAAGIKAAINAGGILYFKEGATVASYAAHPNVTGDLTIYANGADFGGKDISIGTYAAPENNEATVNIYNAKNLYVWGQPVEGRTDVWNVNLYNCENDGYGFVMYRNNENCASSINLTMTNCTGTGYTDSFVHTTADGTIKITGCEFNNNCAPINIAHKQSGNMTVTVENSTFNGCGKVDPANDYFAPARFVNNSSTGTLDVVLKNNIFKDTIGTNGDILLGDYRGGKESHAITAEIITEAPVMVKSSTDVAYSYEGGTITLAN